MTPTFLYGLKIATAATLLCVLFKKYFLPASIAACLFITLYQSIVHSFGEMNHAELVLLYAAYVLSFCSVADRLSVKGSPIGEQNKINLNSIPFISILALMCFTYSFIGIYRLIHGGLSVFTSDSITLWVFKYANIPSNFTSWHLDGLLREHSWLRVIFNVGFPVGTFFEVFAPFCLISRRFRYAFVGFMVPFHIFNWLFLKILFWENLALYILFFELSSQQPKKMEIKQLLRDFLNKILPLSVRRFIKSTRFAIRRFRRILLRKPNIILFYPDHPRQQPYDYLIYYICQDLGLKMINDPKGKFHLCMNWQDCTFGTMDHQLEELCRAGEVINVRCLDISKRHVNVIFKEVFGYSPMIDPLTHQGKCVEKSNLNAKHENKILECPLKKIKEECVYQRLIDSRCDEQFVVDLRVPIFKKTIPFVYIKYKPIKDRFKNSVKGKWVEVDEIFSQDEARKIIVFCEKIGLDCGELDILRDKTDEKLYIIDVNNTPTVWFVGYTPQQRRLLLKRKAQIFEKCFL